MSSLICEVLDIKNYPNTDQEENVPDILQSGEKMHGKLYDGINFKDLKFNGKLYVGGHKLCYEKNEKNIYWKAAKADLENKLEERVKLFRLILIIISISIITCTIILL